VILLRFERFRPRTASLYSQMAHPNELNTGISRATERIIERRGSMFRENCNRPCLSAYEYDGKLRLAESCLRTESRLILAYEILVSYFDHLENVMPEFHERVIQAWKTYHKFSYFVVQSSQRRAGPRQHLPRSLLKGTCIKRQSCVQGRFVSIDSPLIPC